MRGSRNPRGLLPLFSQLHRRPWPGLQKWFVCPLFISVVCYILLFLLFKSGSFYFLALMSEVCTQRLLVLNLWNEEDVHDDKTFYSSRWTRCLHRRKAFQFKPCGSRLWGQSQDSEDWTLQKGFKIFSIKHLLTSIARELKYVGILTETAFEQCGWTERWVTSMIMNMIMIIMTPMTKHWNHVDYLSSPHLDAIFNPLSDLWSAWRSPCTSTTSGTWRWQSQSNTL